MKFSPFLIFAAIVVSVVAWTDFFAPRVEIFPSVPALIELRVAKLRILKAPTLVYPFGRKEPYSARLLSSLSQSIKGQIGESGANLIREYDTGPARIYAREDLRYLHTLELPDEHLALTRRVQALTQSAGASLVILPIAAKISIEAVHRPNLATMSPNPWHSDRRIRRQENAEIYLELGKIAPAETVDVFGGFTARSKAGAHCFAPDNPHWNSYGLASAAVLVISHLRSRGLYDGEIPELSSVEPDLTKGISASALYERLNWRESFFELKETEHRARFTRIILAGTSFSVIYRDKKRDLGNLLEAFFHLPVVNLSYEGAGTSGSVRRLEEMRAQLAPTDLVIWEYPVQEVFGQN